MRLLFLFIAGVAAHEPRFYAGRCGSPTCMVQVSEPHISQVFFEDVRKNKVIAYEISEAVGSLFVEVYKPHGQDPSVCHGATLSIDIRNKPIHHIDLQSEKTTSFMEPFTQIPLERIDEPYTNSSGFDEDDELVIRVAGPTKNMHCKIAVTIGKEERLTFHTLMYYPYISMRSWSWAWDSNTWTAIIFVTCFVSILIFMILFYDLKNTDEFTYSTLLAHLGFSFYLAVFVARMAFMIEARIRTGDASFTANGFAALVLLVDLLMVSFVALFVLQPWFGELAKSSTSCCTFLCCIPRCIYSCLERKTSCFAPALIVVLAFLSLLTFSSGFYLGPSFLVLAVLIGSCKQKGCFENNDIY